MGQPVMQWQILARDPDTVTAFYASLFGWRVNANTPRFGITMCSQKPCISMCGISESIATPRSSIVDTAAVMASG